MAELIRFQIQGAACLARALRRLLSVNLSGVAWQKGKARLIGNEHRFVVEGQRVGDTAEALLAFGEGHRAMM